MIVVVMGVAGAGKTTVARALAVALDWPFIEGDDLHPAANIEKMASGFPLTDEDRAPWLEAIARHIASWGEAGRSGVIACSALRQAYRDRLAAAGETRFIHLDLPPAVARERLGSRRGHFMPATLLDSQFATLEPIAESEDARSLTVDATRPLAEILDQVVTWIGATPSE